MVGYGDIGQETANLARAFKMKILALRRRKELSQHDKDIHLKVQHDLFCMDVSNQFLLTLCHKLYLFCLLHKLCLLRLLWMRRCMWLCELCTCCAGEARFTLQNS